MCVSGGWHELVKKFCFLAIFHPCFATPCQRFFMLYPCNASLLLRPCLATPPTAQLRLANVLCLNVNASTHELVVNLKKWSITWTSGHIEQRQTSWGSKALLDVLGTAPTYTFYIRRDAMDERTIKTPIPKCRLYCCFCLGWCSNFVGSKSGQKQKMAYNITQHPSYPPQPHTVCIIYTVRLLWEGGDGWGRSERR